MYDPSKVERLRTWECNREEEAWHVGPRHLGDKPQFVRASQFDACAEALAEARTDLAARQAVLNETMSLVEFLKRQTETLAQQRDEALRIAREYRNGVKVHGSYCCRVHESGDLRCSACKAADEALGGK